MKYHKHINLLFCLVVMAGWLTTGCERNHNHTVQKPRLTIVTTTGIIGDAVRNLVHDRAEVISLMGPGVDPHLYKATQGDLDKLLQANLIVYNGLHLEGKMSDILEKLSHRKAVYALGNSLPDSLLRPIPGFDNIYDPHIWFDVSLWAKAIGNLTEYLKEFDPENATYYQNNYMVYAATLDSLHEWVRKEISSIPAGQRVLVTAHDAFGYFGAAYGIEVRGLQGISTLSEFGLRDISDLTRFIQERKIKAVFVETSVPEKSIHSLIEGCRERGWDVALGGSLYSDALGAEHTPEGTYTGMIKHNTRTIVEALR